MKAWLSRGLGGAVHVGPSDGTLRLSTCGICIFPTCNRSQYDGTFIRWLPKVCFNNAVLYLAVNAVMFSSELRRARLHQPDRPAVGCC